MKLEYQIDHSTQSIIFSGRIDSTELLNERIAVSIGQEIVRQVAEITVLEKGAEIMAGVDIQAIASMVMAEVVTRMAARIRFGDKE